MKSIERIFQKISQPSKKQTLKRALITGFNLTKQDSSNLKIMLKRMGVKFVSRDICTRRYLFNVHSK